MEYNRAFLPKNWMSGSHFLCSMEFADHCEANSFSLDKAKGSGLAFKVFQ